jgi:hypothetical protein
MAQADLENLTSGKGLFPGFVFLASDEPEAASLQHHPEFLIGGGGHALFEESPRCLVGRVDSEGAHVWSMTGPVGAPAEALELGGVLLGVVERHVDQVAQGSVGRGTLGGKIQFRAQSYEGGVARFDDGGEFGLGQLQYDWRILSPLFPEHPNMRTETAKGFRSYRA